MADFAISVNETSVSWQLDMTSDWHDIGGVMGVENGEVGRATLSIDLTSTTGAGGLGGGQDGFYLDTDLTTPVTSAAGLPTGFQALTLTLTLASEGFITEVFDDTLTPGAVRTYNIAALSIGSMTPDVAHTFTPPPSNALWFGTLVFETEITTSPGVTVFVESPPPFLVQFTGTYDLNGSGGSGTPVTGWYQSDIPGIPVNVGATLVVGATARPASPRGIVIAGPWTDDNPLWGFPGHAVVYKNRLIYAKGGYTVGTDLASIHVWNGTSDYELCKVPGVAATPSNCVVTMAMGDGLIYLTTWDSGTTSADVIGRVLRLNPDSGQLTNVGDINSLAGHVPYSLMFHNGELWTATHRSDATSAGLIARIKPETQTAWTVDLDLTATGQKAVLSMASYKGNFYYGSMGTAGTFAVVGQRTPAAVYSVSLTATGGTASNFNGFYSMVVFGDNLYASYWNPDGTPVSKIYKFDGSAWTTVYNGAGATLVPYVGLYVDNGTLYAIGALKDGSTYSGALLITFDGTTWIDRTSTLVLTDGSTTLTEMMPSNAFGSIAY